MDGKPLHYDGSAQNLNKTTANTSEEPFKITDEMRKNIGSNPYDFNNK